MMGGGPPLTFLKRNHGNRITNFNLFQGFEKNRYKSVQDFKTSLYLFCSFCSKRFNFVILFPALQSKKDNDPHNGPLVTLTHARRSSPQHIPLAILIKKFLLHGYNAGRLVLY